jgi:hypothetical protein
VEGYSVAEHLELSDEVVAVAVSVGPPCEVVASKVVVVAVAGEEVQTDDEDGVAHGLMAFFLPIRRASRQNWAER